MNLTSSSSSLPLPSAALENKHENASNCSNAANCGTKFDLAWENELVMEPFKKDSVYFLPTRGTAESVGYDICSNGEFTILPGEDAMITTGFKVRPPKGYYAQIMSRSGLVVKNKIRVEAGTIDPDYRGEVKVILTNRGAKPFVIATGDKIAQMVLLHFVTPSPIAVSFGHLDATERGAGGFGSTGLK